MSPKKYTEDQRRAYLELATTAGHSEARRQLGYPASRRIGVEWEAKYGVKAAEAIDSKLMIAARACKSLYGFAEQRLVAQRLLDEAWTKLTEGEPVVWVDPETGDIRKHMVSLSARSLSAVANTVRTAIQTLRLVEDKSTAIVEHVGESQPELLALVEEYRARNDATVTALKAVS